MKLISALLLLVALATTERVSSQTLFSSAPETKDSPMVRYYIRKFNNQLYLKQIDSAIVTGNQIIRIRPNNPYYTYQTGLLYDKTGDSITASGYYKHALSIYNSVLDTMDSHSWKYNFAKFYKALNLLLLGKKDDGDNVIKELLSTETKDSNKRYLLLVMSLSRKELIYGSPKANGMAYTGPSILLYKDTTASIKK